MLYRKFEMSSYVKKIYVVANCYERVKKYINTLRKMRIEIVYKKVLPEPAKG